MTAHLLAALVTAVVVVSLTSQVGLGESHVRFQTRTSTAVGAGNTGDLGDDNDGIPGELQHESSIQIYSSIHYLLTYNQAILFYGI